jgi:FkbM family methyltransferase
VVLTRLLEQFPVSIRYYADNDASKHNTGFMGKSVYAPDKIYAEKPVVLIASCWARDIALQLKAHGVTYYDLSFCTDYERWKGHFNKTLFDVSKALETAQTYLHGEDLAAYMGCIRYRQTYDPTHLHPAAFEHYFHPTVAPVAGDLYIDGGAWQGDTLEELKNRFGDAITVHCFEPDGDNRGKLNALIDTRHYQHVSVSRFGLWNKADTLRFFSSGDVNHTMQARVNKDADATAATGLICTEIEALDLDGYCADHELYVGFIKLDVEGAEPQVLEGARRVLREHQPRLAISAYHEPAHLWQLITAIKAANPAYRIYFAHHSQNLFESVVYATVQE